MKKNVVILLLLVISCISRSAPGDPVVDSLKRILLKDRSDTTKLWIENLVAERCINFNPDTAIIIYKQVQREAVNKISSAKGQVLRSYQRTLAEVKNGIGAYFMGTGNSDSAVKYWNEGIELRILLKDDYGICLSYLNMGFVYYYQSDLKGAISYWQKALVLAEKINNPAFQTAALSNLGGIYADLNENDKASDAYLKLVKIDEENHLTDNIDSHYYNLAAIYKSKNDLANCKKYLDKAFTAANKISSVSIISQCYDLRGELFEAEGREDSAQYYFEKCYVLAKEKQIAQILPNACSGLATLFLKQKKLDLALKYANEQYETGKKFNIYTEVQRGAEILSIIYERKGNTNEAFRYLKIFMHLRDSLNKVKNEKDILKNQLEFDHEREKIAIQKEQEKKDALALAENKKNKLIIYFMSFILVLVLLAILFVFRNLNLHKKKNRIISRQKEIVEEKQKEILDSIHYAKRIQQALLPRDNYISKNLRKI